MKMIPINKLRTAVIQLMMCAEKFLKNKTDLTVVDSDGAAKKCGDRPRRLLLVLRARGEHRIHHGLSGNE